MNKVGCFLSGGHRYADIDWVMTEDTKNCQVVFTNHCVKCGKPVEVRVSREDIFSKNIEEILRTSIQKGKQDE